MLTSRSAGSSLKQGRLNATKLPSPYEADLRCQADFLNSQAQPGVSYEVRSIGNGIRLIATVSSPNGRHKAEVDRGGGAVRSFLSGVQELFYVSPSSDYRPGSVPRGADQSGISTFGKRGGDNFPPHFVGRQANFKFWNGPRSSSITSTNLKLLVDHHDLGAHLPKGALADRIIRVNKEVTVTDEGDLEIALDQSTKNIRGDLFLHPYIRQMSSCATLLGVKGLKYEVLNIARGDLPFSQGFNFVKDGDSLALARPMMRIFELSNSESPHKFTYRDGDRTIEMFFQGASHVAIWRPSDEQSLSDLPVGEERDKFVCIEPIYFDQRSEFGDEVFNRRLVVRYRFIPNEAI